MLPMSGPLTVGVVADDELCNNVDPGVGVWCVEVVSVAVDLDTGAFLKCGIVPFN